MMAGTSLMPNPLIMAAWALAGGLIINTPSPAKEIVAGIAFGFGTIFYFVPVLFPKFLEAGMSRFDENKNPEELSYHKVPEGFGVLAGMIYLVTMSLFLPLINEKDLGPFITHLFSICMSLLLGFADDVFVFKRFHKVLMPVIPLLPFINCGFTWLHMVLQTSFVINSISMYTGINGIESASSLIIAGSIFAYNTFYSKSLCGAYMVGPFLGVCAGLLYFNWFPARLFVGQSFTSFTGIVFIFALNFSPIIFLFVIPQTLNFLYSLPQLCFLPCPRGLRSPRWNRDSGLLQHSTIKFSKKEVGFGGELIVRALWATGLVQVHVLGHQQSPTEKKADIMELEDLGVTLSQQSNNVENFDWGTYQSGGTIEMNNMTLVNFILVCFGPQHEQRLAIYLLALQLLFNLLGLIIIHYYLT